MAIAEGVAAMTVTPLGDGRYRITADGRDALAWAAGTAAQRWIFYDGRVFVITSDDTAAAAHAARDDMAFAAPMPAKVAAVNTAPGQTVKRGDVLIMLEAMKMELPITAPRDGRVRSIACRPGELVQPGVPLVDLE
jgi:3-methylcrotonyl-CoA carboxylase alpha subunit